MTGVNDAPAYWVAAGERATSRGDDGRVLFASPTRAPELPRSYTRAATRSTRFRSRPTGGVWRVACGAGRLAELEFGGAYGVRVRRPSGGWDSLGAQLAARPVENHRVLAARRREPDHPAGAVRRTGAAAVRQRRAPRSPGPAAPYMPSTSTLMCKASWRRTGTRSMHWPNPSSNAEA